MNFVERLQGILLSPKTEWPKIGAEDLSVQQIYTGWVMILGAVGPLAILLSSQGLGAAIGQYLILLIVTALVALIVDFLAPSFGGRKGFATSLKLAAFSYTAAYLGGIFAPLGMIGAILSFAAAVYAWYTFYLGAPVLGKCAPEKALPFTIVVVIAGMAIGFLFAVMIGGAGTGPRVALPG